MKIKTRWLQFNDMLTKSSSREYTKFQRIRLFFDFMFNRIFRGIYLIDYIQYKFYDRNKYSRDTFIEYQKLHKIIAMCNNPEKKEIFDSKILFNETFNKHLNREWLNSASCTKEEFMNFTNKHDEIIVKPEVGSFGVGVRRVNCKDVNLEDLYKECKKDTSFLESVVEQHNSLKDFNETSLNTLRIVTLIGKNQEVNIMSAVLRIGRKGKVADNFHSEGLACQIDIDTGIVKTTAVDKNFKKYVLHPDSGKLICGFRIPSWEKVVEKAKELAKVVPDVRYVGWDIAVDKDGEVLCIEGNYSADPDVTQTTDQVGKYFNYVEKI